MLREILEERRLVKVETAKGYEYFSKDEIQQFLEDEKFYFSDTLPKWLMMAIFNSSNNIKTQKKAKKVVERILRDILDGKIKEIRFKRNKFGGIVGFENLKIKDLIKST